MISLDDAVQDLYRIAVVEGKTASTIRLQTLADYCVQELEHRGLEDVEKEAAIAGAGRESNGMSLGATMASIVSGSRSSPYCETSLGLSLTGSMT